MNMMLLRSMQQARYSEHKLRTLWTCGSSIIPIFTSPICRYPDLLVHRMIREYTNNMSQETREHSWRGYSWVNDIIFNSWTSCQWCRTCRWSYEKAEYMEEFAAKNSMVAFVREVWLNLVCLWNCQTLSKVWFTSRPSQNFTITMERYHWHFRVEKIVRLSGWVQPIRVKLTLRIRKQGEYDSNTFQSEYDVTEESRPQGLVRNVKRRRKPSEIEVHVVTVKMETSNVVVNVGYP